MFILTTEIVVLLILCQLIAAAKNKTELRNTTENTVHHVLVKVDGGPSETTTKPYSVKFGHFESKFPWTQARDKFSTPMHYTVNENGCAQFTVENRSINWRLGLFIPGNTAEEELFTSASLKLEKPVIYYLLGKDKSKWKLNETETLPIECKAIAKSLKYKGNAKLIVKINDYPKLQESTLGSANIKIQLLQSADDGKDEILGISYVFQLLKTTDRLTVDKSENQKYFFTSNFLTEIGKAGKGE
ncbi:hypothetical protein Ddc_11947 [Ditylenchus destructor]|nr:hypothetical protein Ddc_11947 [Ditylenchus destructor]